MNFINTWGGMFNESFVNLWGGFISFVPSLLGAIILFFIGWILGAIVGKAIAQLVGALKLDKFFESAGANTFMDRAGVKLNIGGFVGGVVKWFIIIVFLMASLQIIGLTQVNDFLREAVLYYLPKVIVASFVLVIATVIADAMQKLVNTSAKSMNVRSANMLGSITKYAIWIFAFIIALSELGIAPAFMQILFTGVIAALAIALGLSFGLGGRDAAARAIDRVSDNMSMK
jgi:small-conductance mechanosensitive channel